MKIYTRAGDQGSTNLYGGLKISKSSELLAAYGTLDELASILGVLLYHLVPLSECSTCVSQLQTIQKYLLTLSSFLATPHDKRPKLKIAPITEVQVTQLEEWIDAMETQLPPLSAFILPGGHLTSAYAQFARAVTRRAEREVIHCYELRPAWTVPSSIELINRLSDYLFVLSRYLNFKMKIAETTWP